MIEKSNILEIFKVFLSRHPQQFFLLFLLLVIEGLAVSLSILTLVPMAEFMLNPSLNNPSAITYRLISILEFIGLEAKFWVFGGLFVISNLIKSCLDIGIRFAVLKIKYAVTLGLVNESLEAFFRAKWEFFSSSGQGELLNTINKELNNISDILGQLATTLAQIVQLSIFLAIPLLLNLKLTLTAFILALIFGIPFFFLNRLSYRLGKSNTETANIAMGILSELLGAARLILSFSRQDQSRKLFISAFNNHIDATLKSQTLASAIPKFFQPMAMLAVVIAIGYAVENNSPISELVAIMWSLLNAMPLLASLLHANIVVNNFLPSYDQLLLMRKNALKLEELQGNIEFIKLCYGIEFKNLSFSYSGRQHSLKSLNLFIQKGKMTALVGESGSGKSTLLDLVLGLQIPSQGEILVDGISLSKLHLNSFREKIGYVPQDPQLFNSSIRENLLWASSKATDPDLWDALQRSNAENFVKELPKGLDTVVGDRGVRLSGGQRQRIALARAILRKPELLILDEATSSLDSESEELIQKSLINFANHATILVVAHRLSSIMKADTVYVLEQGSIVEEGSFANLSIKPGSRLNKLLTKQMNLTALPSIKD